MSKKWGKQMILIVEDDELLNRGLQHCLNDEGLDAEGAYNMLQAKQMASSNDYDLVILDVNLPDGSGFTLFEMIRNTLPEVPIIFLTARDLEKDALRGFDLGADDYVTKPFNINILKKKIIAILKRYQKVKDNVYEAKEIRVDFDKREVYKNMKKINLTPTEYKILELFIKMKNKVITKEMIIELLYSQEGDYIEEHALAVYISRLRGKIEKEDSRFIKTIYGMGYMWIE